MTKKKAVAAIFLLLVAVISNYFIFKFEPNIDDEWITFSVSIRSDRELQCQARYLKEGQALENGFTDAQLISETYENKGDVQEISFSIPANTQYFRFDPCDNGAVTSVSNMAIYYNDRKLDMDMGHLENALLLNEENCFSEDKKTIQIDSTNIDPYFIWEFDVDSIQKAIQEENALKTLITKFLICVVIDIIFLMAWMHRRTLWEIPKEIISNRKLIFSLSKNDFKTKFAGSYFGIVWEFIQPIVTILVYWFVFDKALNAGTQSTRAGITVPFVLWLIAGIVPWFFFSDTLVSGTNVLIEYNYLVKKVVFKISTLPIVKIISNLFVHLFFIAFTLILFTCYQYFPTVYSLQMLYYSFCMIVLSLGIIYATSAIVIFFRDLTQVINIVLQVGMWVTPIMWNMDAMYGRVSPILLSLLKLNPMYYVVSGYRDALINHIWFWDRPEITLYFWIVVMIVFGVGISIFRRLQVHFADVL